MLRGPALSYLDQALAVAYPRRDMLERAFTMQLNRNLEDYAGPASPNSQMRALVLQAAAAEGWLPELEGLLSRSQQVDVPAYLARYRRELDSLQAAIAEGHDPFLVHRIGAQSFLDFRELREKLRELLSPDGPRVLIVTGDRPCGKTYSWPLLDALGRHHGFEPIRVDLETLPATEQTPLHVMTSIALQMGITREPLVDWHAASSGQARRLFEWLVGQTRNDQHHWLIVIDSLDKLASLPAETRELASLIGIAAVENRINGLRVILLGHQDRLPIDVAGWVLTQELYDLGVADVAEFFSYLVTIGEIPADADTVDLAVQEIGDLIAQHDNRWERLSRLGNEVNRATQRLRAQGRKP